MLLFRKRLVLTVFSIVALVTPGFADDTVIDKVNEHAFLSATITGPHGGSLYHEVCNLSGRPSAFVWRRVGLGIDALNQLRPELCARRTQRGIENLSSTYARVDFQDGSSAEVSSIFQCHHIFGLDSCGAPLFGRALSRALDLSIFMTAPDQNNVEMETVTVGFRDQGEYVEFFVESSDGIEHFAIVLSATEASADEIRKIIGEQGSLVINTFGFFRENKTVDPSFLTQEIPSQSPTLLFKRNEKGGTRVHFKVKDINRLGRIFSMLIIQGQKVVAMTDAFTPQTR
jgi:hypothetical protein